VTRGIGAAGLWALRPSRPVTLVAAGQAAEYTKNLALQLLLSWKGGVAGADAATHSGGAD
jgi:hypothetical protein